MRESGTSAAVEREESPAVVVESGTASERVEELHDYVTTHQTDLHEEMVEARETLHFGTASDAIQFANRDLQQDASEAAARWRAGAHA